MTSHPPSLCPLRWSPLARLEVPRLSRRRFQHQAKGRKISCALLTYDWSAFLFTLVLESTLHDFFESSHVPVSLPANSCVSAPMTLRWLLYLDMPQVPFR